jgi:hypothetical protein
MFYKCLSLWKLIINYRELRKYETNCIGFIIPGRSPLSCPSLEPSPFYPRVHSVEFVVAARHCAMWVWDAGTPQLVIGMSWTGILSHDRIAYLSYTAPSTLCCFAHSPLPLYIATCCEACIVPCSWNQDVARDGWPCCEQRPLLHTWQPRAAT